MIRFNINNSSIFKKYSENLKTFDFIKKISYNKKK